MAPQQDAGGLTVESLAMSNLTSHLPLFSAEFSPPFTSFFDAHSPHSPVADAFELS
jgi:hypothetical protein